jgi:hypothetical protein
LGSLSNPGATLKTGTLIHTIQRSVLYVRRDPTQLS